MFELYPWVKALHVMSIIAWMAGLLYLPRLFVYHCGVAPGSEASETFKVMERRLLRGIMNPAMIAAYLFGITMIAINPALMQEGWLHAKILFVLLLTGIHMMSARWRRDFEAGRNRHSQRYYRVMNEVPAVLMAGIVIFVIVRPF
ncbi:protoporphyrinogen oxidase HemJ [Azospirillum sp. SYSU D00513]|uniref:protoporphyrinogen oxidase HemJ n=1 Tax=Azospirillum sp. SYSU D00513 TaxID=2812561 RepID=UPI001A97B14E|nr:protoporphyrinogen oxidase HemJ [Azospirillum sp. SYSU D00513]